MRKIVKPTIRCKCCGQITKYQETEEFCDQCKTLIDGKKVYPLHFVVFVHGSEETYDVNLCSWKCVKQYLIKHKRRLLKAEFFDLPYPSNPRGNDKPYSGVMKDFFEVFVGKETSP